MGYIKTTYQAKVRFYHDDPRETLVTWYFVDETHDQFTDYHRFHTGNYADSRIEEWPGVGEVKGTKKFVRASNVCGYKGKKGCHQGTLEQFAKGMSINDPAPPVPKCCGPEAEVQPEEMLVTGGEATAFPLPAFVAGTLGQGLGTAALVAKPAGAEPGDVLLLCLFNWLAPGNYVSPAGFTALGDGNSAFADVAPPTLTGSFYRYCYRVLDGTEPAFWAVPSSPSGSKRQAWIALLYRFAGVPIMGSVVKDLSDAFVVPGVAVPAGSTALVSFFGTSDGSDPTPPGDYDHVAGGIATGNIAATVWASPDQPEGTVPVAHFSMNDVERINAVMIALPPSLGS